MGGKFKFQVQDSDLAYLFWRFEKLIALSEKKPSLENWLVLLESSVCNNKKTRGGQINQKG